MIFDFVNVIQEDCVLNQALIRDRRNPNLYLLAASQTRDKDVLSIEGVGRVLEELKGEFDYVVLDSPAGIENGARHAMYFADDAIITTNPELSACRDSDKMIGKENRLSVCPSVRPSVRSPAHSYVRLSSSPHASVLSFLPPQQK